MICHSGKFMPELENHTLRLLAEIRRQGDATHRASMSSVRAFMTMKIPMILRRDMTQRFEHLGERIEHLRDWSAGESVLGRYAAAQCRRAIGRARKADLRAGGPIVRFTLSTQRHVDRRFRQFHPKQRW